MKWIKHDTDANQDAKLQNVLLDYGLEGYGLYWYCIELIAGKVDKENITFELEHDARIIARNTGCTPQKVEEMMKYFVKIGLFECSNNVITCLKLAKRLDKSMTSNPQMREIIEKLKSHDSIMTQSEDSMQDKIRLDQNRSDNKDLVTDTRQHDQRFDFDEIREIWNEARGKVDVKSSRSDVMPEKAKKSLPKVYAKYISVCKAKGKDPSSRSEFCKGYFHAVLERAKSFTGMDGEHKNWKPNIEYASRVDTYDKVLEWLAND